MIEFCAEYPFLQLPNKHYAGFAYDGRYTYLSSSDKQVIVCDEKNQQMKMIETTRFYPTLCYDPVSDCFWAAGQETPGVLYRLSANLEELEKIDLENYGGAIQGLSYVSHKDALLFFNNEQIYLTDRAGQVQKLGDDERCKGFTMGVCAVEQGLLRLFTRQRHYYLSFLSDKQIKTEEILSRESQAKAMAIYPDKNRDGFVGIRILAVKYERKPSLYEYTFDPRPYGAQPQEDEIPIELSETKPQAAAEPHCEPCCPKPYNPTPCPDHCEPSPCCPKPCKPMPCPEPCHPKPCHPNPCKPAGCCTFDCCENYAKVLESIALVEASIAHILNAEGEKLQKVIQKDASICELLQVNASVQKTIVHATHLEHTLYGKLEALLQVDCDTCKQPCPKPCPKPCEPPQCQCVPCKRNEDDDAVSQAEE